MKNLAKTGEKGLSVAEQLFQEEDTGIEVSDNIVTKKIKILSSDSQFKYFSDPENLSIADYGKLFLFENRDTLLTSDELVDEVTGTLMRSAYGFYVYPRLSDGKPDTAEKPLGSGPGMIRQEERDWWFDKYEEQAYQNNVRVILCTANYEKATQMMNYGENPFVELRLNKTSYGAWFPVGSMMNNAIKDDDNYPYQTAKKASASVFKLTITSKEAKSGKGKKYYIFEVSAVETNAPEDAAKLLPLANRWKEVPLFGNWGVEAPVETGNEEEIIEPDDLPWN